MSWSHSHVEGTQNYSSLLYLPRKAPLDLLLQRDERHGLRLYVRRVFIMDAAEQLLPHYLRFMRGVVDSDDLPLNVSRELLQENDLVRKIRAAVVKRSLDLLTRLAKQDPEQYQAFWDQFGAVLKEGIVTESEDSRRLREQQAEQRALQRADRTGPERRPDKRQRRQIIRFRKEGSE